jgi:hypothetical protein
VLRTPPLSAVAVAAQVEAWDAALRDERDEALLAGFVDLFPGVNGVVAEASPRDSRRSAVLKSIRMRA